MRSGTAVSGSSTIRPCAVAIICGRGWRRLLPSKWLRLDAQVFVVDLARHRRSGSQHDPVRIRPLPSRSRRSRPRRHDDDAMHFSAAAHDHALGFETSRDKTIDADGAREPELALELHAIIDDEGRLEARGSSGLSEVVNRRSNMGTGTMGARARCACHSLSCHAPGRPGISGAKLRLRGTQSRPIPARLRHHSPEGESRKAMRSPRSRNAAIKALQGPTFGCRNDEVIGERACRPLHAVARSFDIEAKARHKLAHMRISRGLFARKDE